ncbi:ZYRO0D06270p [Zygosaccharomyces rouxii]|uniref:ZYRO0D06270p n=1 Tax=Zygosaccharomyces rouxii (strain ATCC 2623 / CBS 732 / NBRC 1130 / NCYC 568 / NRRL Y-229) TaxID=559307 RepID=C5DVF4_ZYGRC|nr:uncharacterized protein ZYRO0D06270g [Zygosaccharomyces rouxii]KAH9200686.1 hypothetical protein LQ764DRAFT_97592 [Zygosaccharomyces rouxii]CAR27773.1 ZYRO0D06270p [Zygosaccharomyces rouxii]
MNGLSNITADMRATGTGGGNTSNHANGGARPGIPGALNETISTPTPTSKAASADKADGPMRTLDNVFDPRIPQLLPHENMYKIQIGNKLFKISGASLSSDGPSYFTKCFSESTAETQDQVVFIDRSAEVFQLIYDHLQGYFINIENEVQYTMLYADAMYYNLPRLRTLLKETEYYFTNIGGKSFKVPRSLFRRKGDSPNYFLMTSAALYADVENVFIEKKLLRPPPQAPPYVGRSPEYFNDLMHLLGGSSLELDDCRRESLIKECRYYRFLNLEQRLIKHKIIYNPCAHHEDICIKLSDLNRRGVQLPLEEEKLMCPLNSETPPFEDDRYSSSNSETEQSQTPSSQRLPSHQQQQQQQQSREPPLKRPKTSHTAATSDVKICWNILKYSRPYVDDYPRELSFQIDRPECTLIFDKRFKTIHVCLYNETAHQFEDMFSSELSRMGINLASSKVKTGSNESAPYSKHSVLLALPACVSVCDLSINGVKCPSVRLLLADNQNDQQVPNLNSASPAPPCPGFKLHLAKSMWKLGVRHGELMMIATKAESFKGVKEFCKLINYL